MSRGATVIRRPLFWFVLAVVLSGGGVAAVAARGERVQTARVERARLEQHILASGRVRVPTRVQVAAQTGGLVVTVAAAEGNRVARGDLLIQLDDSEARAAEAQARASVAQARARVDQLSRVGRIVATEALRQAETNLEDAEARLARDEPLAASGAIPAAELDDVRRDVARARAQRAAAEAQRIAAMPSGTDSRIALTALLEAEARAEGAAARLSQTRLVAPDRGTLLSRAVEPGDVVQPGRTLMVLAVDSDTQLVFDADERNLPFIALGQAAVASADAFPEDRFGARVSFIAPAVDAQRGSVEVQLVVATPPAVLRPDMTVSIDLTVATKERALTLPAAAVHATATAAPWVLAVEGGRARRRPVKLGIRGSGSVEVVSGLTEGASVILPEGKQPAEGARVRAEPVER